MHNPCKSDIPWSFHLTLIKQNHTVYWWNLMNVFFHSYSISIQMYFLTRCLTRTSTTYQLILLSTELRSGLAPVWIVWCLQKSHINGLKEWHLCNRHWTYNIVGLRRIYISLIMMYAIYCTYMDKIQLQCKNCKNITFYQPGARRLVNDNTVIIVIIISIKCQKKNTYTVHTYNLCTQHRGDSGNELM